MNKIVIFFSKKNSEEICSYFNTYLENYIAHNIKVIVLCESLLDFEFLKV